MRAPRNLVLAIIESVVVTLVLSGCGPARRVAEDVGVVDRRPGVPPVIDVIVDSGGGSPGSSENVDGLVGTVARQYASFPGVVLRVWWLGNDDTTLVGTYVVPPPLKSNTRALQEHVRTVTSTAVQYFHARAAPYFAHLHRTRSPIIEGIATVSVAENPTGGARTTLVLSDLLEESRFARLECGSLPTPEVFARRVHAVLPEGSLGGMTVIAVLSRPARIDGYRCPVRIERFRAITALFDRVISAAGGHFVLSPTAFPVLRKEQV